MPGYWTPLGAPSLVDWCEPNYAVSPFVAEWWNTLSSLAMAAIGLAGLWRMRNGALRFRFGMLGATGCGLGSAAFHATLLRVGQAFDELPMVWLGLACAWTMADRAKAPGEGKPLALGLAAFGAAFCVAYATVPWAFALFIAVYGLVVAWLAIRTMHLSFFSESSGEIKRKAALVVIAFLGAFFLLWIPEHVLLGCENPVQVFQLHSGWHIGAAVGTVAWWEWAALDRARAARAQAA